MSAPFLLNPSSLGFALRSPFLPASPAPPSNQPIFSSSSSPPPSSQAAPAGVWGHFPSQETSLSSSSLNLTASLSLFPAIYGQAEQEPLPPGNGDKRVVDSVHVSFLAEGTDGPIMAPSTGPIGANTNNVTGSDQMRRDPAKGKAPLILNHAANSVQVISGQVAQDTFFKDKVFDSVNVPTIGADDSDDVYYMDPSLGFLSPPMPTFSPAKSPLTPNFSWRSSLSMPTFSPVSTGVQFFKERLTDEVYMPAHAHGKGTQVTTIGLGPMHNGNDNTRTGFVRSIGPRGTTSTANDDVYMGVPSKGKSPLIPNQINLGSNQVYANETHAEYLFLMNRVTHLSQTQSTLNATMADMKTLNLGLKWWVVKAHIITSDKVAAHDREVEKKIEDLNAKVDKEKKKGETMEAEQAKLKEKVNGLDEKSLKLEGELEMKKDKFEMLKKKSKKSGAIWKYCCIGGFVAGASIFAVRWFVK